ncbi:hypothetical protein GH714_035244 [Hevea brasiliensis]|uniref:RING-type domain-containing protein n=1 Tax=Hevea brasiliensis TaxID=3981 RepID=A0A6A6KHB4_HEVBR|nr:hypothetical protein GH714_035244 [Hevea brasiliensis]
MDVSSTKRDSESKTETFPLLMERPESLNSSEHIIDIPRSSIASPSTSHDRTSSGLEASPLENRSSTSVRTPISHPSTFSSNGPNTRNSSFVRRGEARRRRSPLNSGLWISVELVLTISQIVASIVVLSVSRNEHPRAPLFEWIVGYASGCVATLPLLYWRYRQRSQVLGQDSAQPRQGSTHISVPAGPYSVSVSRNSEADDHRTAVTSPRGGQNVGAVNAREDLGQTRGATAESIDALPTYKFKENQNRNCDDGDSNWGAGDGGIVAVGTEQERVISGEDAVCCICLAKYANNDELRELPCSHFFHKECVDKWLKINASCPLCKSEEPVSIGYSSVEVIPISAIADAGHPNGSAGTYFKQFTLINTNGNNWTRDQWSCISADVNAKYADGNDGARSPDALSQHISVSSNQAQPFETMPNNNVLQKLSGSNMQVGQMDPQAYSLASEQFLLPSKQLGEMETLLNNVGSQQPSMLSKRKAPIEPIFNNPGLQKLSMPNKRAAQMEHRPWLQQMSVPNKLPVHMQLQSNSNTSGSQRSQAQSKRSTSSKAGLQQSSIQRNYSGQPSPKVQNESSESVRSKLRESLATALALVSQKKDKNEAAAAGPIQENSQPSEQTSGTADVSEECRGSLPTKMDPLAQQCSAVQYISQEISSNNTVDSMQTSKNDGQDSQSTICSRDEDASFSDSFFVKDELLQGNGLSWVLEPVKMEEKKDVGIAQKQTNPEVLCMDSEGQAAPSPQILATKIEAELYKLFGGVNKKYKEKGRSLLFNLKDRNNPELRERVMSGEIPPERLCSMTAEELASKELSQWRIAKAEELAQMVVLPDSDVDMRRLVKKTHKGEFQVEVEPQDSVSVEVAIGASSLARTRPKLKEKEASSPSKPDQKKDKGNATSEKNSSEDRNVLMIPSSEGSDLMQGLMVDDELKDAEFLPPIVSLDEFMESLNSEPPFENLPVDNGKMIPASDKADSQVSLESKSPDATLRDSCDTTSGKSDVMDVKNTQLDADDKSTDNHVKSKVAPPLAMPKGERVWEGLLQLNISSTASVIGIFRSGEKTSAKDWSGFIEIKGRVRMDAFEKFLQELPMSRSRAVMALHFVCKEGSTESERAGLSEVADSYVMDGRVGLAEPAPGVELYFCPPQSKTSEMLAEVLPKGQVDTLNAIDNGLIGVIVWRKPQITSTVSPNWASQHKHNSKKHHSFSRRQEKDANVNVNVAPKQALPVLGFLPVLNLNLMRMTMMMCLLGLAHRPLGMTMTYLSLIFHVVLLHQGHSFPPIVLLGGKGCPYQLHSPKPSRPVDQMRQLVQRYGQTSASLGNWQNNRSIGVAMQPWNDDDDDMPEWHPEDNKAQIPQLQPVQVHGMQQLMLRSHMVQQTPRPQIVPQAMPLQTPMNVMHGQQNTTRSWQQGTWTVPSNHVNAAYQSNGAPSGLEAGQHGTAWRRDAPKSSGF